MKNFLYVFLMALIFAACGKNNAETPSDIKTDKVFINSATGSTWEYLLTHNDIPFDSPFYIENTGIDTLFENRTYSILHNVNAAGENVMPYYIHTFEDKRLLQPHLYDADAAQKIHLPLIDLNREIQESWTLELGPGQRQIFFVDSINLSLKGFDDVFKIVSENFQSDQFVSTTSYYYHIEIGLLRRVTIDNASNANFTSELVDWNVFYD